MIALLQLGVEVDVRAVDIGVLDLVVDLAGAATLKDGRAMVLKKKDCFAKKHLIKTLVDKHKWPLPLFGT